MLKRTSRLGAPKPGGAKKARREESLIEAPRANDPVRLHVRETLERRAVYAQGALQADMTASVSQAVPTVVLPPRAEHNARTLLPEHVRPMADLLPMTQAWNETAPMDVLRYMYAPNMFALAARLRADGQHLVAPQAVADAVETLAGIGADSLNRESPVGADKSATAPSAERDAEPTAPLFPAAGTVESVTLLKKPMDTRKGGARPVHLVDPAIGPLSAPQRQLPTVQGGGPRADPKRVYHEALEAFSLSYYAEDPVPDPRLAFGLQPRMYPMLQNIIAESREHWTGNNDLNNAAAEAMPRTTVETVQRAYLQEALLPPDPAFQERACCAGDNCRVRRLAREEDRPNVGYCPKEFFTPTQQDAWRRRRQANAPLADEKPPGLCWLCTLGHWTDVHMNGLRHKQAPLHAMNTIKVYVGRGGYATDCLLPEALDHVKTTIAGHVPYFDKMHYQFEQLPDGQTVLCEVNSDFHDSLSQSNTCLGVRKTRALAGSAFSGTRPLTPERAAAHLRHWNATHLPRMWVHFLCTAPGPVLADRALVDALGVSREPTRVPVLWLRQAYGLDSRETVPPTIREAMRVRLAPTTGAQLMRHFRCDTPTALAQQLVRDMRGALTPFEDAVEHAATHPREVERVIDLLFDPAATALSWVRDAVGSEFAGLVMQRPPRDTDGGLLWRTVLWRTVVALLAQRVLRPYALAATGEECARNTRYFIHTHLAFLVTVYSALARPGARLCVLDDAYWLQPPADKAGGEAPLVAAYPQATAVVCAEELPDMSPLLFSTNDTYDMPGKKSPMSQINAILQPEFKTLNGTCQRRGFDGIIHSSMLNYSSVGAVLALIMRVVLLGNLPNTAAPLPLAAAMRVHASFCDAAVPARLLAWVRAHPLISMALLREHHFFVCESNGIVDERRSLFKSWQRFKALARQCGGQIRRFIAAETATRGLRAPFDWSVLEQPVGNTSVGEVLHWHEKQKEHNVKLRKDSDVGLLLKKMRPEEKRLDLATLEKAYAWMRADGRLEATHICAFRAARQRQTALEGAGALAGSLMRSAVPTGYLKLLGLSEVSFTALRDWLHLSVEFASPDNPIKKAFAVMVDTCPQDVVLLKTYLRLVEYYSNSLPFFLPDDQTRATILAARADLGMPDFVATSPRLGYAYYCRGCLTWATPLVEPSNELLCLPPVALTSKKRRVRRVNPAGLSGAAGALPVAQTRKKPPPARPWPARPCLIGEGRATCMKKVVFNPLDATLYCHRCDLPGAAAAAARAAAEVANSSASPLGSDVRAKAASDDSAQDDGDDDDEERDDDDEAHDVSRPLFDDMNCTQPLLAMDMLGVWRWARGRLYGICVYCARLCEVHAVNLTNMGLSCGEHALVNEYPRFHRIWKHIQRPVVPAAPLLVPQRCFFTGCETRQRVMTEVDVYDAQFTRAKIHLCEWHHHCVRALLPRAKNTVTPPVSLQTMLAIAARTGKLV
jgi:hypothetical protein